MKYSSDTGEPILSEAEQEAAWQADEELQQIMNCKREFEHALDHVRMRFPYIDHASLRDLVKEAFDDAMHKEWHQQKAISGSVDWPDEIPPFGTLTCDTPKKRGDREFQARRPVPTNPATGNNRTTFADSSGGCRVVEEVDIFAAMGRK